MNVLCLVAMFAIRGKLNLLGRCVVVKHVVGVDGYLYLAEDLRTVSLPGSRNLPQDTAI